MDIDENIQYVLDKACMGKYGSENIVQLLFSTYDNAEKEFKKIKKCACDGCENPSIVHSHTVPKTASLNRICDNSHMYHPTFIKKFPLENEIYIMERIGVNEATTFPGFCLEHEQLFSDYEIDGKFNNGQQVLKQIYRSVCRNLLVCRKTIKKQKDFIDKYNSKRDNEATKELSLLINRKNVNVKNCEIKGMDKTSVFLYTHLYQQEKTFKKLENLKKKLWNCINEKDEDLILISVLFDEMIPLAMCGYTMFREKLVIMNVIPLENSTLVAVLFENVEMDEFNIYIDNVLKTPLGILNLIESMMVYGSDDWYIQPSMWDSLNEQKKYSILHAMSFEDKFVFENSKYSIFDDFRKKLINIMEEYGEDEKVIETEKRKLNYTGKSYNKF